LPFSRPGVRRFSGTTPNDPCQGDPANAFYCPADKVISVAPDRELNPIPDAHRTGWLLAVMAHEYGHHIQKLSGIDEASDRRQRDYPYRSPVWLELNRRMELQANCFAGVGIAAMSGRGSVGAAELADAASSNGGDDGQPGRPRDHGTIANNLKWFQTGLDAGRPAICNTWLAAAGKVA
jgi:predicted metalloprotease